MRNAWRLLFFNRSIPRFSSTISRIEPPSLLVRSSQLSNPSSLPLLYQNPRSRCFSEEPLIDPKKVQDRVLLAKIFSRPIGVDEIDAEFDSSDLTLDQEMVHSVLKSFKESLEKAKKFFDWVAGREAKESLLLRSKSYNLMLEIVGKEGKSEEFWGLVKIMEKKGFRITKDTFLKVLERFKSEGMEKDLKLLNELYFMKTPQIMAIRVNKLLKEGEEVEVIQNKLQGLEIDLSSDLVVTVLDRIHTYPDKALLFYGWVEENPSFEMDGRVRNAMARVLGREDCITYFWEILRKMRNAGYEVERETYVKVVDRFYKRKIIVPVVELFEFMMGGKEKPSFEDFLFLLKKVVVGKDLDLSLVSKVVQIYKGAGNSIKGSCFGGVVKSLRSVGRLAECDKVLKAMEEGGFVADASVYDQVVLGLCDAGKLDEASEYIDNLERSGMKPDTNTWSSLVKRHSLANQLDKAISCFKKMVERKGGDNVGCAFELLIHEFCQKKTPKDAFKILKETVTQKNVKPWHSTYKFMIEKLLSQGNLEEASDLLELMKGHGFPPFIDSFVGYVSKSGSANEAMIFLKAMTVDEFPSTSVFVRVFEALLTEGKHRVAHDLLSLSPGCVRNHEDVLNLFYSMKLDEAATAATL